MITAYQVYAPQPNICDMATALDNSSTVRKSTQFDQRVSDWGCAKILRRHSQVTSDVTSFLLTKKTLDTWQRCFPNTPHSWTMIHSESLRRVLNQTANDRQLKPTEKQNCSPEGEIYCSLYLFIKK